MRTRQMAQLVSATGRRGSGDQCILARPVFDGKAKRRTHSVQWAASRLVKADAHIPYALLNVHGIDEANLPVVISHDE